MDAPFNKKSLELFLECTVNSAGHSEIFDFLGTLSNIDVCIMVKSLEKTL